MSVNFLSFHYMPRNSLKHSLSKRGNEGCLGGGWLNAIFGIQMEASFLFICVYLQHNSRSFWYGSFDLSKNTSLDLLVCLVFFFMIS